MRWFCEWAGLHSLRKNIVLKGHGFNRAERATEEMAALAAEGCFLESPQPVQSRRTRRLATVFAMPHANIVVYGCS
jgi:hypothetical protein